MWTSLIDTWDKLEAEAWAEVETKSDPGISDEQEF